ncbi:MAG: TetR/AcrR family transcriptional regulator [Myxococcales bacterium]|nr:TetR/AcrR family transcriptional regulator [Myxococcales bacterium]
MTVHSVFEDRTISASASTQGSGSASPSQSDKRARILAAAETVFAESGFFQAKVSQIAKEAGVADGTIYLYFKSKDDVLISLFESRMSEVCERMRINVAVAETVSEKLQSFVRTHLGMVEEHPNLAEVLTVELRQSAKFMKEHPNPQFGEYLKILATIIADGQEAGDFDAEIPAPVAARGIFGMVDELALAWLLGAEQKFDIVRAADWVGALILRGLERKKL